MPNATALTYRTESHEGRTLRFAELGEGPAVVLLHGFPDNPDSWTETATLLADAGYTAIVPYLRGYHRDTIVEDLKYDRDSYGGDVVALLDVLEIERAVIVGHDWGASAAWSAYSLAPDRFAGIVPIAVPHPATIAPSLGFAWQVRHFWYFKAPFSDWRTQRNNLAYIDRLYRRWAPNWNGSDKEETLSKGRSVLSDPIVLHHALEWYRDLALGSDDSSDFRLQCPGLVVVGEEDFGGDLTAYHRSVERFDATAELLVIDNAGHWPHREDSATFIKSLLGFVQRCTS